MNPINRRSRFAFTLIELLVVVAIITALLAILLPAMGRAIEVTHRAVCASNQKQLQIAALDYAAENQGRYQPTHRRGYTDTSDDHVSWLNHEVYDRHEKQITADLTIFTCPNRGIEFVQEWDAPKRYRVGYYFFYGRNMGIWSFAPFTAWDSPQSVSRPGDGIMIGDIIEIGTQLPTGNSSTSHSTSGIAYGAQWDYPEDNSSEGGNFAFADGSVHWRPQAELVERNASNGGAVRGFW